ncbi:MAG: 4'-phosphopantetheinyl transferase family protein [Paludibacteraceae bacterium]
MLYEIFDHMHLCTDEAVREMLPLVSEQRRQQALRYSHTFGRFCCLKSYLMLLELLSAVYPELDTSKPEFGYTAQGKPFLLARPDIHFSISHTKNAILVAISDAPIGVDIEAFRSPSAALIARTMNATEQAAIATAATPSGLLEPPGTPEALFSAIWTRKEAVLKLRGTGIEGDLKHVLSGAEAIFTRIFPRKSYAFSIAQQTISPFEILH